MLELLNPIHDCDIPQYVYDTMMKSTVQVCYDFSEEIQDNIQTLIRYYESHLHKLQQHGKWNVPT